MYPIIFQFGPITIYSFRVFMALAALLAAWVVHAELKRQGFDSELASTMVFAAAIGGLIGARSLSARHPGSSDADLRADRGDHHLQYSLVVAQARLRARNHRVALSDSHWYIALCRRVLAHQSRVGSRSHRVPMDHAGLIAVGLFPLCVRRTSGALEKDVARG